MALKFRFKTREEIPAEHQGLYVERDGAFVLNVEAAVEKTRLDDGVDDVDGGDLRQQFSLNRFSSPGA